MLQDASTSITFLRGYETSSSLGCNQTNRFVSFASTNGFSQTVLGACDGKVRQRGTCFVVG